MVPAGEEVESLLVEVMFVLDVFVVAAVREEVVVVMMFVLDVFVVPGGRRNFCVCGCVR